MAVKNILNDNFAWLIPTLLWKYVYNDKINRLWW